MSSSRLHPSLPAPVVHAGFLVSQSKSHVLAGLQDAYWSDDDGEDAECPLCLEEMDISDLNFKPCICGYQVCRFCWHHIKENLNGRCPACRRVYTDEAVQFKPIAKEDHKRLTQQKKQRERERKELDALGRRHLANVRIVQRNVVYVVGIGPRFAKEELIPTLRSNEYFGQYGKITKILIVKRTPSGGGAPVVGLYITYHRREDAARAIAAVDGTASPGGGRDVMRASYGTTKYCMAFLRGISCNDHGCMSFHDWGDEKDCFTKEDLTTLKHTMKATESRSRTTTTSKKSEESEGLPRAASWANKGSVSTSAPQTTTAVPPLSTSSTPRTTRRGGARQSRSTAISHSDTRGSSATSRTQPDRKPGSTSTAAKAPSQASSSRPSTPASSLLPQRPITPADVRVLRHKKERQPSQPPALCHSPTVESDLGSGSQDVAPVSPAVRPRSTESMQSSSASILSAPSAPPGLPAVPPGLSAPPGIPAPGARVPRPDTTSPQMPVTPLLSSQTSYQMSTAAKALLDDVKARWKTHLTSVNASPFPDFDRTLQTLSAGDGQFSGFSFNLDPKLAGDDTNDATLDFEVEANPPFHGTYLDAFPGLKTPSSSFMAPPGLPYPHSPISAIYDPTTPVTSRSLPTSAIEKQDGAAYKGSFNPFADNHDDPAKFSSRIAQPSPVDDDGERKVSRFGFARGRKSSAAASSPMPASSPMSNIDTPTAFYTTAEYPPLSAQPQWMTPAIRQQQSDYDFPPPSASLTHIIQTPSTYPQQQSYFQPFESEPQLRDIIQPGRILTGPSDQQLSQSKFSSQPPFHDPAIMSAKLASPVVYSPPGYNMMASTEIRTDGPLPGPSSQANPVAPISHIKTNSASQAAATRPLSPPLPLSPSDFPALTSTTDRTIGGPRRDEPGQPGESTLGNAQAKAERKAAKKAAATEKAAEKQALAQERAAAKAAEKAKTAQEKADKRAAVVKAQPEKLQKETTEKDKAAKEKALQVEKEKSTKPAKERAAKSQKEVAQEKKTKQLDAPKSPKRSEATTSSVAPRQTAKPSAATVVTDPPPQVPLLSKRPKKNKPTAKPIRIPKEEELAPATPVSSNLAPEPTQHPSANKPIPFSESSSNNSRAQSVDHSISNDPTSIEELVEDIDLRNPAMDLANHPFFDLSKINPSATMPLEYGPLVHALSALSVGGGSFANNIPSGSIDNAVSSFQQLLETLTQTISDLLRLLPRTTWDDSSSFDGVLRDMLKGDDFLDDGGDDGPGKEDEVAALTLALERRARWMEVQLSKLEELHRDINTAAVRAVLSFNDNGWDRHGFLPRVGNTRHRFDNISLIEDGGVMRRMSMDELEKKLVAAKKAASAAETEVREFMERMQDIKPLEVEG